MIRDSEDPKIKQIRISQKTYDELVKRGRLDDTFDTVIKKMLFGVDNRLATSHDTKSRN